MANVSPRYKILTIEDDDSVRMSIAAYLEDSGYEVLEAADGDRGLDMFHRGKPDLVLADIRMPGIDGLDILSRITAESPETPVIIVSGAGLVSHAVEALRRGAWDYILKPVSDMSTLGHAVDKALERARLKKENREYREQLEELVARRTRELEESNEKLKSLNLRLHDIVRITRRLSGINRLESFAQELLSDFSTGVNADGGSFYLVETAGLRLVYSIDPGHAAPFIPFPLTEGSVFRRVIGSGKALLLDNIEESGEILPSGWPSYRNGSVLTLPVADEQGNVAGIISLHSKGPPPFTEQDVEIGSILAYYISEALRAVKASEALIKSEEKYRTFIETASEGYWLVDTEGRILDVNKSICDMLGYRREEMTGTLCADYFDGDEGTPAGGTLPESLPGQGHRETVMRHRLGNTVHVLVGTTPLNDAGNIGAVSFSLITNITELKEAEKEWEKLQSQLFQSQKMEAIGTLAGGIAHDFNNLLTVINGTAQLMQMKSESGNPFEEDINEILRAGEKAFLLTRQLLTFSRKQIATPVRVDLNSIIRGSRNMYRRLIGEDVRIDLSLHPDDLIIDADPVQVEQILLNLLVNARDALYEQKSAGKPMLITIETGRTRQDREHDTSHTGLSEGEYAVLKVSDTGKGMPEEVMTKIFEPFFTTKTSGKGTGLGLSTVYGIVRQNGGSIRVESSPGHGSAFTLLWPLSQRKAGTEVYTPPVSVRPGGKERILLVEDDQGVAIFTRRVLESRGYRVIWCKNGSEAFELLTSGREHLDLMVTDIVMPEMSGTELVQKAAATGCRLPVMYITGYGDEYLAGIDRKSLNLIYKPFTIDTLLETVRRVLDGGQ